MGIGGPWGSAEPVWLSWALFHVYIPSEGGCSHCWLVAIFQDLYIQCTLVALAWGEKGTGAHHLSKEAIENFCIFALKSMNHSDNQYFSFLQRAFLLFAKELA